MFACVELALGLLILTFVQRENMSEIENTVLIIDIPSGPSEMTRLDEYGRYGGVHINSCGVRNQRIMLRKADFGWSIDH